MFLKKIYDHTVEKIYVFVTQIYKKIRQRKCSIHVHDLHFYDSEKTILIVFFEVIKEVIKNFICIHSVLLAIV